MSHLRQSFLNHFVLNAAATDPVANATSRARRATTVIAARTTGYAATNFTNVPTMRLNGSHIACLGLVEWWMPKLSFRVLSSRVSRTPSCGRGDG